ncbi:hypothetical protein N657DRAFT_152770 [Parathielavia appendiculata]|uniref:Uncharacterized protein n=1 Tax=Parathielavia appendiculata TaxID=2587402 RepID=A0AAN6Z057_9PEZI|nr:hypothetical protein N657DRAFT_152770 [Parathielavia appendiculata]
MQYMFNGRNRVQTGKRKTAMQLAAGDLNMRTLSRPSQRTQQEICSRESRSPPSRSSSEPPLPSSHPSYSRTSSFGCFPLAMAGLPTPFTSITDHPAVHHVLLYHHSATITQASPNTCRQSSPPTAGASIVHLLIAATLNHLRRTFVPWLGQWIWYAHPLDDLRLAVSNPDVFLGEVILGYSSTWAVGSSALKVIWHVGMLAALSRLLDGIGDDTGGERTLGMVRGGRRRGRKGGSEGKKKGWSVGKAARMKRMKQDDSYGEVWTDTARVGYLLWVMVTAEYVFARAMNTAACLVACYKILTGGETGRVTLRYVLRTNLLKVPFVLWQLVWYLRNGFWPLVLGSVSWAVHGQPGLLITGLGCMGGVMALLKYRSTFYIALEICNVFVFLGFVLVGLVVLRLGIYSNPLGCK